MSLSLRDKAETFEVFANHINRGKAAFYEEIGIDFVSPRFLIFYRQPHRIKLYPFSDKPLADVCRVNNHAAATPAAAPPASLASSGTLARANSPAGVTL